MDAYSHAYLAKLHFSSNKKDKFEFEEDRGAGFTRCGQQSRVVTPSRLWSVVGIKQKDSPVQMLESFRADNINRIQSTKLVKSILGGKPKRQHYMGYLIDVYNYAQHSPTVIAVAGSRCIKTHPELGQYLFRHASEEVGHEQWALSDLKDCGMREERIPQLRPTPSCMSMIALEYYVAGTWNPVALFGWLYALESLGDAMGVLLSKSLGQGLQLGGKAVYFLEGHGEADHHHRHDLENQITKHVTASKDIDDLFYIAQISSDLYARMIEEVCERDDQWLSTLA